MPSMSPLIMTLPSRTTPTVSCACAVAIGALIAAAIAVIASSLFRMFDSFAMMHAAFRRHANRPNSSRAASFPKNSVWCRCKFWQFFDVSEPAETTSVSYRGTALADKMPLSRFDIFPTSSPHIAQRRQFYGHYVSPHSAYRGPGCRRPYFDHAALSQSGGRDLSDFHRFGGSGPVQDVPHLTSRQASQLARSRPKWCKAHAPFSSRGLFASHGQSRRQ